MGAIRQKSPHGKRRLGGAAIVWGVSVWGVAAMGVALALVAGSAQADLLLYYDFEEGAGTIAGNQGTTGTAGVVAGSNAGSNWVAGAAGGFSPGGALRFNGLNNAAADGGTHVQTGFSSDALGMNGAVNYTASAWFNLDAFVPAPGHNDGDAMIFGQTGTDLLLHNGVRGQSAHFGHWGNDTGGNQTLQTGQWTHVTYRYKDGVQSIWLNGQNDATAARGGLNNSAPVIIGDTHNTDNRSFLGLLDEIAVYNDGLAFNQIEHLASGGDPRALPAPQSVSLVGSVAADANGRVGGQAFEARNGAAAAGVSWSVKMFRENLPADPNVSSPGLTTQIFKGPNHNSSGAWDTFLATNPTPSEPAFLASTINWGDGGGGVGNVGYYSGFNAASANIDNYSVRMTGQIFIPKPGMYKFKDGNDDYTFLSIDGAVLVDDNDWTSTNGVDNNGSPIATADFTGVGAQGEWLDFEFRMAEGGGGDRGTLYWDYDPVTGTVGGNAAFPATQTTPAGAAALVGADFFRTPFPGGDLLIGTLTGVSQVGDENGIGTFMDGAESLQVPPNVGPVRVELTVQPQNGELGFTIIDRFVNADVNADGVINTGDYDIIRDNFLRTGVDPQEGDLNLDGVVDLEDFKIWKDAFVILGGAAPASVPEPGGLILLGLGLAALTVLRKRGGFGRRG